MGLYHDAITALQSIATNTTGPFGGELNSDPETTLVNTVAADSNFTLGKYYTYGAKIFQYVQFVDAVVYADGQPAVWTATPYVVTNDISGGLVATVPRPAGAILGVQTENYYGFILVHGSHTLATPAGTDDAVAGDLLYCVDTADGVVENTANGVPIGFALADDDDAADTVSTFINTFTTTLT